MFGVRTVVCVAVVVCFGLNVTTTVALSVRVGAKANCNRDSAITEHQALIAEILELEAENQLLLSHIQQALNTTSSQQKQQHDAVFESWSHVLDVFGQGHMTQVLMEAITSQATVRLKELRDEEKKALLAQNNNNNNHVTVFDKSMSVDKGVANSFCPKNFLMNNPNTWLEFVYPYICLLGKVFAIGTATQSQQGSALTSEIIELIPDVNVIVALAVGTDLVMSRDVYKLASLQMLIFERAYNGSLPERMGEMSDLRYIVFAHSGVAVNFPPSVGQLQRLERIDIRTSPFGSIPSELGNVTSLNWLAIFDTNCSGTLPSQLGRLTNLEIFELVNVGLEGTIPTEVFNLSPDLLIWFDLSANFLTGTIPSEIGQLSNVESIVLRNNWLSGTIPIEIGSLQHLKKLYLQNNRFSGSVPYSLGYRSVALDFQFYSNDFTGSIPSEILSNHNITIACWHAGVTDKFCLSSPIYISKATFGVFTALAIVGCVIVAVSLVVVVRNRKKKIILASTPLFSVLTLIGCFLMCAAVPLYATTLVSCTDYQQHAACALFPQLLSYGVLIVLSCIVARHYRVFRIFVSNTQLKTISIPNRVLLFGVATVFLVDVVIMVVYSAVFIKVPYYASSCDFAMPNALLIANIAIIALLMMIAAALAVGIRNVPDSFNETKHINLGIVNILIYSFIALVFTLTNAGLQQTFIVNSALILIFAMSIIGFIYLPKFIKLYKGQGNIVDAQIYGVSANPKRKSQDNNNNNATNSKNLSISHPQQHHNTTSKPSHSERGRGNSNISGGGGSGLDSIAKSLAGVDSTMAGRISIDDGQSSIIGKSYTKGQRKSNPSSVPSERKLSDNLV